MDAAVELFNSQRCLPFVGCQRAHQVLFESGHAMLTESGLEEAATEKRGAHRSIEMQHIGTGVDRSFAEFDFRLDPSRVVGTHQ